MPIVVRHDVSPLFAGYAAFRAGEARGAVEMAQHMQRMALEREKLERANALEMLRLAMEHQMQQQMMPLRFMEAMQRNIALEQAQRRLGLQEKEHELRVAAFERAPELMEREHQQRLELSEREQQQRLELQRAKEAWEREQLRRRQEWEFISEQHKRISQWALDKLNRLSPQHRHQANSILRMLDQVAAMQDLAAEDKAKVMNQLWAEIDALPEIDRKILNQQDFEDSIVVNPRTGREYLYGRRSGGPAAKELDSGEWEAEAKTYEARLKQWEAKANALNKQITHLRNRLRDEAAQAEDVTNLRSRLENLEYEYFRHLEQIPESPEFTRFKEAQRRSEQPQPSPKPTESRPPVEQPTPPPPPPEPELSLEEKVKAAYEAIKSSPVQIPDAPTEQQLAAMSPDQLSDAVQPLADAMGKLVDQKKALNKAELERDIYNAGIKDVEARFEYAKAQYEKINKHLKTASEMERERKEAIAARKEGRMQDAARHTMRFYSLAKERDRSVFQERLSPDASVREFAKAHLRGLVSANMPENVIQFAENRYWKVLDEDIPSQYWLRAHNVLIGDLNTVTRHDAAVLLRWARAEQKRASGRKKEALQALAAAADNYLSTSTFGERYLYSLADRSASWTPADFAKAMIAISHGRPDENHPIRDAVAKYGNERIIPSLERLANAAEAAGESPRVTGALRRLIDCLPWSTALSESDLELLRRHHKRMLVFAHQPGNRDVLPDVHALGAAIEVMEDVARWQWAVMR